MWLSKTVYELLPYCYLAAGLVLLATSMYLDHWLWPILGTLVGLACLLAGLVVWLKRRDYRRRRRNYGVSLDETGL